MANDRFLFSQHVLYLSLSLILIFFSCVIFYFFIRKRIIKKLIKKIPNFFNYRLSLKKIVSIIRIDKALYEITEKKPALVKALFYRMLGWLGGAFEIYVFLWIIGFQPSIIDVIILGHFQVCY